MDAETLKALKKSITHWEGNAKVDFLKSLLPKEGEAQ